MAKNNMSIEQAIRILHPETTAAALAEIGYYAGFRSEEAELEAVNEACIVACEVMQKYLLEHEDTPKGKRRYSM